MAKKAAKKPAKKPAGRGGKRASADKPASVPPLFGTDGIRCRAGRDALTPENVLAVGRALGRHLHVKGKGRPLVLLGVDPRPSSDMVASALAAGLKAEGCDVHWPGMMSTPEIAFLTGHGPFAAGIAVTASHNAVDDNGIKVFGADGRKLAPAVERKIERAVRSGRAHGPASGNHRFGQLNRTRLTNYEDYIVRTFRRSFMALRKRPLAVVFDVAFGARSVDIQVISHLAHSLALGRSVPSFQVGASMAASGEAADNALEVYFLNAASPNHPEHREWINRDCGSLHPDGCARALDEIGADVGVCFDGDGDRCIMIDEKGGLCDGDHMLALLAADMKAHGKLSNDVVVSTTMANLGLERALDEIGVKLIRTDVGDRHVAEAMLKNGAALGGEQSGHIILGDEGHVSGDGLYTALRVIEVMLDTGKPLSELTAGVRKYPQAILNVKASSKPALGRLKELRKQQRAVERELGDGGRVNIRYSGTEPLLRIMVEAPDDETVKKVGNRLARAARNDLKALV